MQHKYGTWNYIYGSMSIAQRVSRIYGGIMPSVPRSNYIKCSCQYVCTYQILPYMHENMKSLHIRNRRGKVLRFWKPMLHTLANEQILMVNTNLWIHRRCKTNFNQEKYQIANNVSVSGFSYDTKNIYIYIYIPIALLGSQ